MLSDFSSHKKQRKRILSGKKDNTRNKNSSVRKTKQSRLMHLSNYAVCGKKELRFSKQ